MNKIVLIVLVFIGGAACSSIPAKEATLIDCGPEEFVFKIKAPAGEKYFNPHGGYWSQQVNFYEITTTEINGKTDYDKARVMLFKDKKKVEVELTKGVVESKYLSGSCSLSIQLKSEDGKNMIINGKYDIERCNQSVKNYKAKKCFDLL